MSTGIRYINVRTFHCNRLIQIANHIRTAYLKTAITKQEANGLTKPTTRIPDTDAYVVELEVFHQLHCLHYIRKAVFSPNATDLMFMEDPDITPEHIGKFDEIATWT